MSIDDIADQVDPKSEPDLVRTHYTFPTVQLASLSPQWSPLSRPVWIKNVFLSALARCGEEAEEEGGRMGRWARAVVSIVILSTTTG